MATSYCITTVWVQLATLSVFHLETALADSHTSAVCLDTALAHSHNFAKSVPLDILPCALVFAWLWLHTSTLGFLMKLPQKYYILPPHLGFGISHARRDIGH
jgi:hypothetical protein